MIFFLFLHENIYCGYSLGAPWQGNISFHGEIRKISVLFIWCLLYWKKQKYHSSAQHDQSWLSPSKCIGYLTVHRVPSTDSGQTAWMHRLIWVFTGYTCLKLHYLILRHTYNYKLFGLKIRELNVRKHTVWHVFPTKTQISMCIHTIWLESSLSTWRNFASLAIQNVPSEDSDQSARMCRLIWTLAEHICLKLHFLTLWFTFVFQHSLEVLCNNDEKTLGFQLEIYSRYIDSVKVGLEVSEWLWG